MSGPLVRTDGPSEMRSCAGPASVNSILKNSPVLAQGLLKVLEKLEIGAESLTFLYLMTAGNAPMFSGVDVTCVADVDCR